MLFHLRDAGKVDLEAQVLDALMPRCTFNRRSNTA
jgi:hypothetical protein